MKARRHSPAWREAMAGRVMRRVRRASGLSWCFALGTVLLTAGALLVPRAVQSEMEVYEVALVDMPTPRPTRIFEGRSVVGGPVQVKLQTDSQEAGRAAPVDIAF